MLTNAALENGGTMDKVEVFKIPQTGKGDIRIPAGFQPLIEPAAVFPVVPPHILSSSLLNPVVKQGDHRCMHNAHGSKFPENPGVSGKHLGNLSGCIFPPCTRFVRIGKVRRTSGIRNGIPESVKPVPYR